MGQITALTYAKCKTTPDGFFYIPDNTFAIPVKQSSLKLFSDFIDNWSKYRSVDALSFTASGQGSYGPTSMSGSFSADYQDTKQRQVDQSSLTSRIYFRDTLYTIHTEPTIELDPAFKSQLLKIVDQLELNHTRTASVLLQLIVRDYGTHYLTRLDAGGILMQEDFLSKNVIESNEEIRAQIKTAASASYFAKFGGSLGFGYTVNTETSKATGYFENLKSSNVRAYGGDPLKVIVINETDRWIDTLPSNPVAVDRFGDPLHFLVTPYHFPDLSLLVLAKLQRKLKKAIGQYYKYNRHDGCTTMGSPNFEYNANVDNNDCNSTYHNYTFGGAFIYCNEDSGGCGNLCDGQLQQRNILTGAFSCPDGFSVMLLRQKEFTKHCRLWWGKRKESKSILSSRWCYMHGNVPNNTGAMFGGTYTSKVQNPLTQSKGCPPTFEDVLLVPDLHICIGTDYELGSKFAVPFGGFFSCQFGNPLFDIVVKLRMGNLGTGSGVYPAVCPPGCSQHTAIIDDGCIINYCIKANSLSVHRPMPVLLPPFLDMAELYNYYTNAGEIEPEGTDAWVILGICLAAAIILGLAVIAAEIWRKRRSDCVHLPLEADEDTGLLSHEESYQNGGIDDQES